MVILPKHRHVVAYYGAVGIEKYWCIACNRYSFIQDGHTVCCNEAISSYPTAEQRVCEARAPRKPIKNALKDRLLSEQGYACLYCTHGFGSIVYRAGIPILLRVEFDHAVPFSYSQNNGDSNYVAACHICNRMKWNYMFDTLDEAKQFIRIEWLRRGYKSYL